MQEQERIELAREINFRSHVSGASLTLEAGAAGTVEKVNEHYGKIVVRFADDIWAGLSEDDVRPTTRRRGKS